MAPGAGWIAGRDDVSTPSKMLQRDHAETADRKPCAYWFGSAARRRCGLEGQRWRRATFAREKVSPDAGRRVWLQNESEVVAGSVDPGLDHRSRDREVDRHAAAAEEAAEC